VERGWKGWLEDRRPNSAADPYKVAGRIVKTVKSADVTFVMDGKLKEELVA
jgi:glutamine synthetase